MTSLLRAEARKALTTRSLLLLAGVVVVYPALSLLPALTASEAPDVDGGTLLQILRGGADVLAIAALLLGILAVAGEYRHGTVVPTLLAAPRRERFVAVKLTSQAALGVALGVGVCVVGLLAGGSYLTGRDVSLDLLSADVVATVAAVILVGALYATIGAAVGALVRNQTAAVAGALLWVFAIENAVPLVLRQPGLKRWLPGGAADRLLHLADPLAGTGSAWVALAMLAGVTAALAFAAAVFTRTADIH
ncbi:MAG TPA: ABC transporter permease subunit [Acidimicrobiales bacterium]|nr:ABC transporter permease subunit [Acidimicrobiales bacterium]